MNFKTTIFLLGLLIAVGIFMLMTRNTGTATTDNNNTSPQGPDAGVKFLNISTDKVNRLHIQSFSGSNVTVEKDKTGNWRLTEPVNAPALKLNVESLLSEILDMQSQGKPDTDPGDQSGLKKPRYHIEIGTDDGKTTTVDLGTTTGAGDLMYARENNGDINLVPATIDRTLKTAADNLRDKRLIALNSSDVQQFRITRDGKSLSAAKVNGTWKIVEPTDLPGDDDSIRTLLDSITTTEASSFVKSDAPEVAFAGFNRPTMTVWLGTNTPTTQPATTVPSNAPGGMTLTIGSPATIAKDSYYVQLADGTVAKIASSSMQSMEKTATDLRDRNIVTIPPSDVEAIKIEKDTYPAPATKPSTGPSTAPDQSVAATMPSPSATKITELVHRPAKPAPVAAATTQPTTVASSESATTQMASTQAASTQSATTQAVAAASLPATQPAMQSIWQLVSDPDAEVDDARVSLLLGTFSPLRADKWVDSVPTTQPILKYLVDLTMKPASATEKPVVNHLEIFKISDDTNYYAIFNGMTFAVSSSLIDELDSDFHKSATPPPDMPSPMGMPIPGAQ